MRGQPGALLGSGYGCQPVMQWGEQSDKRGRAEGWTCEVKVAGGAPSANGTEVALMALGWDRMALSAVWPDWLRYVRAGVGV